jgi:hypothetical protein
MLPIDQPEKLYKVPEGNPAYQSKVTRSSVVNFYLSDSF